MKRPAVFAVGAVVLGILLAVGLWYTRQREAGIAGLANPYRLSRTDERRLLRYFGDASRHNAYQITAATLAHWMAIHKPMVIIDVRQPFGSDGFVQGHVPGAHNIPIQDFGLELTATHAYSAKEGTYFSDGSLVVPATVQFFPLPHNEPIIVMCYDGMGGEMTPALLRVLGYQAYGLRWGLSSWSPALNVWKPAADINPYPVAVGEAKAPAAAPLTGNDQLGAALAAQVAPIYQALNHAYPAGYGRPWTIDAATLELSLNSETPPQVIDLRSPAAYARGHIPGSVNIPFADLGRDIDAVSRQGTVVLASATLQRAAQACLVLRLLGIRAYVLQRGLSTWNPEFSPPPPVTAHYPVATGSL